MDTRCSPSFRVETRVPKLAARRPRCVSPCSFPPGRRAPPRQPCSHSSLEAHGGAAVWADAIDAAWPQARWLLLSRRRETGEGGGSPARPPPRFPRPPPVRSTLSVRSGVLRPCTLPQSNACSLRRWMRPPQLRDDAAAAYWEVRGGELVMPTTTTTT